MCVMRLAVAGVAIARLGACIFLRGDEAPSQSSVLHRQGSGLGLSSQVYKNRASSDRTLPHIVFILADDLGYNGVGYQNPEIKTPTLDKLASEGVKLDSYYAAPICGPSRFSLFTGRSPWKSEAWTSAQFQFGVPVGTSLRYKMLPAALKEAGYRTHLVGKWHQGYFKQDYYPQNRGFDTFYGSLQGCVAHPTQQMCEAQCKSGVTVLDLMDSTREISADDIDTSIVADDRYRLRAIELIRNHTSAQPMFLLVAFHHPHLPIDTPPQYSSRYNFDEDDKNRYYGLISNLDDNVKEICNALADAGMWENTLFVFSSDNGGSQQLIQDTDFVHYLNYPLKGYKGGVNEGGIKVPAFVSGGFLPNGARGSRRDGLTSITDWYATLADLVGVQVDESGPYGSDSIANWGYITGEQNASARTGSLQFAETGFAYIEGKWKLVSQNEHVHLYDLENDPSEEHDISAANEDILSRLKTYFDDPPFRSFVKEVNQLENCLKLGFTKSYFNLKICPDASIKFLEQLDDDQESFDGCWATANTPSLGFSNLDTTDYFLYD